MAAAFLLSWQPKINKQGFNFTENSIVKIKGLYILPFDKKHLLRKMVTWTINCQYTLLPHPCQDIYWILYTFLFKMLLTLASRSTWNMLFGNVCFFEKRMKSLWENLILSEAFERLLFKRFKNEAASQMSDEFSTSLVKMEIQ